MKDPCEGCWFRADPYDCWGCPNTDIYLKYVESLLKEDSKMADGDCGNCKYIDECGVYAYNCPYAIYLSCKDPDILQRLINIAHVLGSATDAMEKLLEENALDDANFDNAKFHIRKFCDILNEGTYKKFKELGLDKED